MTAKSLKHKFASAVADGADPTLVRPSNWNDDHNFYLGINAQTNTSYTIADTDAWTLITYNNAAAVAVTLPQAGASAQFASGHVTFHRNLGAGEVTITPATSTINGNATLALAQGQDAIVISDGTNYSAIVTNAGSAEATVASAATCDIGNTQTARAAISGTATITSFGTKPDRIRFVRFTAALTLTHNATSLILPNAANISTAAGDTAIFISDSSGNWRCWIYARIIALANSSLANMTDSTIKGRAVGAGTGAPADLTAAQAAAIIGSVGGALKSALVSFTRDLSAASGTQAITGVGFTPTAVLFVGGVGGSGTWGLVDSARTSGNLTNIGTTISFTLNTSAITFFTEATASHFQQATVQSYDADGFTLSWTKTGSPTGTATMKALCFR
jgi:hypothetical protein